MSHFTVKNVNYDKFSCIEIFDEKGELYTESPEYRNSNRRREESLKETRLMSSQWLAVVILKVQSEGHTIDLDPQMHKFLSGITTWVNKTTVS